MHFINSDVLCRNRHYNRPVWSSKKVLYYPLDHQVKQQFLFQLLSSVKKAHQFPVLILYELSYLFNYVWIFSLNHMDKMDMLGFLFCDFVTPCP